MTKIPKVFISYSHDTVEHKLWVLELATRLRKNGIDAIIDQWELKPGDDLPHFMEKNLREADKVIMVCSENYVEKANTGKGGVGYEKMIVTASLLKNIDENKIIPLIKQISTTHLPTFLSSKLYLNFSKAENFEFSYDELVRAIHGSPIYEKPEIGNNPFDQITDLPPKQHDGIIELMKAIVYCYNVTTNNFIYYNLVKMEFSGSRIMLDMLLDESVSIGYITRDKDGDIFLTPEGRKYAVNMGIA